MKLVSVLLLTIVIKISSNPVDRQARGLAGNRTASMEWKQKPPEKSFGARYYVGSQLMGWLEAALGYVQSGLNLLIWKGGSDGGSVGRSGKSRINYKGYQVLRVDAQNQRQLDDLEALPDEVDGIDFWTQPAKKYPTDILVSPDSVEEVREYLRDKTIDYEILIKDLQKVIAYENPKMSKDQRDILVGRRGHPMTWSRYHRYSDMVRYMEFLVFSFPHLVELITIGYSTEGLPLKVVRISTDGEYRHKEARGGSKPSFWIDGGIHGREWITSSVVMYIMRQLVENYEKHRSVVDNADWYLMPVVNPDGYEYSHSTDRLWRKTRSNHETSDNDFAGRFFFGTCEGVDLNRNFDFHWGETGASEDPCNEKYAGPRPFSEPETKAMADFIMDKREQLQMYLSLRSYNQMWLVPWSYTKKRTPDYEEMVAMAKKAIEAIGRVTGSEYGVGASASMASPTSGSSEDWAKGVANVKYTYAVELRDRGTYGFLVPATQIIPTAKEVFVAIKTMARMIICQN